MKRTDREWWVDGAGRNLLRGVPGDEDNPPLLPEDYIIDFLRHVPAARESFNRLYPTMLPEERERLDILAQSAGNLTISPKTRSDRFQRSQNTVGIHTTGPYGGQRRGK